MENKEQENLHDISKDITNLPGPRQSLGKSYWCLLSAVAIADLGDGLTLVTLPWLATTLTNNALLISFVAVAMRLPWLFLSLPAGVLIDRLPRKRLLMSMSISRAALLGVLALIVFLGWITIPLLIAATFLIGTIEVFFDSTAQTLVPSTIHSHQLERANGLLSTVESITNDVIGRAIGGLLLELQFFLPLLIDAVTAVCSFPLLFGLQVASHTEKHTRQIHFISDLREGVFIVWQQPLLRGITFLSMMMTLMLSSILAIQVLFVREILGLNSLGFGLIISVSAIGSIAGGLSAAWLQRIVGMRNTLLLSLLLIGLSIALAGLSSSCILVGLLYIVESFFVVVWSILSLSLRQRLVPDTLLGRVGGVSRLFSLGISPLGMLLGGFCVSVGGRIWYHEFALRIPYLLLGIVYAILFLIALRLLKRTNLEKVSTIYR